MATVTVTLQDYKTSEKAWWCPGCGDFGVLAALQKALVELEIEPHNVAVVAGIGCSGKIGNYINAYNIHVTHGRTMPVALGLKLANRDLTVIAAGGDGDGYAIGMSHFLHAMRRNPDITYIVMDNRIYGLTKGQTSPTSQTGFETKSTPDGNLERPVQPIQLALAAGATYVAQGFSSNQKQLVRLIKGAIQHKGFALVNTFSPCVTFNKVNTYDWFKEHLVDLDEVPDYDPHDRVAAMRFVAEHDGLVTGLIYQEPESIPFEEKLPGLGRRPLAAQDLRPDKEKLQQILAQFR
ncbi:2-oxoacid:ferredoxin oxidoreductase subunit beta [Caldinitratiruptor microaerophilus]|uniref:2-oxoacid:ferredoxin oxidoreductase subunit beta n=1 Tax=Caldinitratiruptor microaerophilus TaxID=671077 RepID=A0AA35G5A9_9FIRM|nr:2-oxoacid:ferredoxin oxidoreductase subunit beta [Caldinitratiruptor microaerophilus]BDG59056.1 2-oxoacid:ferredoxin oxidoreductase subunit beta [Caldinitratiruptor microaerophilus]